MPHSFSQSSPVAGLRSLFASARSFASLTLAALLVVLAVAAPASRASAEPVRNVLVFFVDDLRPELGCYGVDRIHSPHIDGLAQSGVLFERAYCQQAICAPSRISMMTGRYPDRIGIQGLFTQMRPNLPDVMSLSRYFQEAGHKTLSFGKVYHHFGDDAESWTERPERPGAKYADPDVLKAIDARVREARRSGLRGRELFSYGTGPATEIADVRDEAYQDGAVAVQAIDAMRRHRNNPFLLCVGFAKPHLPFAAPRKYWDLYDRAEFEVPERTLPEGAPAIAFTPWGELRAYQGIPKEDKFLSDELTAELRHGYAASVSFADAQIGKVLAELDRLGLRESTAIVLWGDHGYKLGDHGQWCKHTNFEIDTRVPFIVSAPGLPKGKRSDALVEMIDIFPTVAELAGKPIPEGLDGKSLLPVLHDPEGEKVRSYALSEYRRGSIMGYSIRDDRFRYTEWIHRQSAEVRERELYDHADTQLSHVNIADNDEFAEVVARMSAALDAPGRLKVEPLLKNP